MGLSWDWDGRDTVPFVRVGAGPARPAPPPPPRFFPAAPRVSPATISLILGLAASKGLLAAVPSSRAAEALASWAAVRDVGAAHGGTAFGGWRPSPPRRGLKGIRALGIPLLAFALARGTEDSASPGLRPARS